ncbi:MAG TPA: hypothetical protein VGO62_20905 [Myxococcota bacterium]|jgi:hypothetical protein
MKINKATPLFIVDAIEPLLPLYQALGLKKTVEVPHGKALGFVILAGDGSELMLQTRASLQDDAASVAAHAKDSLLYCDVDSLEKARAGVKKDKSCTILIEERTTPYGAKELWFVDASGHVVGLAENQ